MKMVLLLLWLGLLGAGVCRHRRQGRAEFLKESRQLRMKQEGGLSVLSRRERALGQQRARGGLAFRFKQQVKGRAKAKDEDVQTSGSVLKKGWLKFLIFDPREGEELANFFVNNAFFEEKKRKMLKGEAEGEAD